MLNILHMSQAQTKQQRITIPYTPRPLQREIHTALYNNGKRIRFAVLAIHRRFGKSVFAINECIAGALTCPLQDPKFFYIAPTFKQAKNIAWEYLKGFTRNIPGIKFYETELRVVLPNNAMIYLSGAENYETLRGNYCDGVVLDEWGNMAPKVFKEVLRPALSDRLGWCIFLGTPNGKNHFYDTYQKGLKKDKWLARTFRADETGIIAPEELEDARDEQGEDEYRQEFLCDWTASVRGSFYAAEMERVYKEGRIMNVPHAQALPVDTAWDLGLDDATAIWFVQCVGQEVRLIDHAEFRNTSLSDILLELSRKPYRYGNCYLPHDAAVRELTTGNPRTKIFEESQMFDAVEVTPVQKIEDGINAARILLPQCFFDKVKTAYGRDCLENYRKQLDSKTGEFTNKPVHDKYSHSADALRYLAINYHPQLGEVIERANVSRLRSRGQRGWQPKIIRAR
jgi:hypothetical protein